MLEKIRKFAMQQVDQAKYGTRKHTRKEMKWGRATKGEPKCGIHENALVAQH